MATSDGPPISVPNVTLAVARGASAPSGPGSVGDGVEPTLLFDSFESGDMSAPNGPAPYLNRDGFTWGSLNKTSVVTMSQAGNPTVVFNGNSIYNELVGDPRDWTAKNGDYCLRFRYTAMPNGEWTENKFFTGGVYPELWMSWWLRVPTNYVHQGVNYKFFYIWQSGYTADPTTHGPTIGMELRPDDTGSIISIQGTNGAEVFRIPEDRGRWMHIVVQVKQNSAPGVADGINKIWRRWADASTYDVLRNEENIDMPTSTIAGEQGFKDGYLMGWHNGGYAENTEWLIDAFKLSETSLLEV